MIKIQAEILNRNGLTPTEIKIVALVCQGLLNKNIAKQLFMSPKTVDKHLQSVYQQLHLTSSPLNNRAVLIIYALGNDMIKTKIIPTFLFLLLAFFSYAIAPSYATTADLNNIVVIADSSEEGSEDDSGSCNGGATIANR